MALDIIEQQLSVVGKNKFKFKINDNRSTMLSVKWEPDCTRVSMHRMFLEAPRQVINELISYLTREQEAISPTIREFIETNLRKLDYSHLLKPDQLLTKGEVYDLQAIYNKLNRQYFGGKLQLKIAWFGKHRQRTRSQVTFGLYHDQLKLVKINRILDGLHIPDYVIEYVMYHEMVHSVCPGHFDERGHHRVHSKEFKAVEMRYHAYQEAVDWLKNNYRDLN